MTAQIVSCPFCITLIVLYYGFITVTFYNSFPKKKVILSLFMNGEKKLRKIKSFAKVFKLVIGGQIPSYLILGSMFLSNPGLLILKYLYVNHYSQTKAFCTEIFEEILAMRLATSKAFLNKERLFKKIFYSTSLHCIYF